MSEIDKIIAKYDKIFNIDRSQVDQEIQAVLPTIIEGFVEFYGEDKRQKIEEKIRNAIIFATPIDIVSKVNEMKSELNRYMREKYPGSFEFNGLNYIPVSNEQQF